MVTPSLKEQARRNWEGIQLDVIGPKPAPGATTLFFQHGDQAVEAVWKTSTSWCLLNLYTWTVTSATSPTRFTVEYNRTRAYPACISTPGDTRLTVDVAGSHKENGRTVYDIAYVSPANFAATRTVCSAAWNGSDRCGYKTPGFTMPPLPVP